MANMKSKRLPRDSLQERPNRSLFFFPDTVCPDSDTVCLPSFMNPRKFMKPTKHFRKEPSNSLEVLWSTPDVARFIRCSERQIFALRKQGLPAILVGGMVRFDPAKVRSWLSGMDDPQPESERARQLADLASENDHDAAQCAAVDLSHEFPGSPA